MCEQYMYILQCMYKNNNLKPKVIKDKTILNIQNTIYCSATNAILLTQSLFCDSPVMIVTYFQCSAYQLSIHHPIGTNLIF